MEDNVKILFLDIDGVMIAGPQVMVNIDSSHHRIFPDTTIAVLNAICERTGALIVFNSTHNQHWEGIPDIEYALVNHGFKAEFIHPTECRTQYPAKRRPEAIADWLSRHPEVEDRWVALDDAKCADEPHMVLVNPAAGVDCDHANQIIEFFGGQAIIMFF